MTTRSTPPRAPSIPEKEAPSIVSDPHLYECFKKLIEWMQQTSAWMAGLAFPGDASLYLDGTGHFTAPSVDGGTP